MIKLRNYKDSDFKQVVTLFKKNKLYDKSVDKKNILKKKSRNDPSSMIILEDNKIVVGVVFIVYDPWSSFIYRLVIHPKYRRQNLATKLMNEAEKRLRKRGVHLATLFVKENDKKVVKFYEKRGWSAWGKDVEMEKHI